ncbi:hypothetical protein N431DRAFT_555275 [Stipitochalara longipes BDJ]|nr:hypothetical protein N431DRAFT_555275 [Stipitochalara longipes BDJ]
MTQATPDTFSDFDNADVYKDSLDHNLRDSTRNFVVEFGADEARIAFNVSTDGVSNLLKKKASSKLPVRWINVWGPHRQPELVDVLGTHYKLSLRLQAIIRSPPPKNPAPSQNKDKPVSRSSRPKPSQKNDPETALTSSELQLPKYPSPSSSTAPALVRSNTTRGGSTDVDHYTLADQMQNYHAIDVGRHYVCIGANWMHELPTKIDESVDIVEEGKQKRLYSWLFLCDDHTVISFHEYPGQFKDTADLNAMRSNTLSVLKQLSTVGLDKTDPLSLQTVRYALKAEAVKDAPGIEGSSLLFYYLFDDWRAVYSTVGRFHHRLDTLQNAIFDDMSRKSHKNPNIKIIPKLHVLGRQVRQMQHVYKGYKNLCNRVIDPKATTIQGSPVKNGSHVLISQSASQRFERLSDRIEILILSEMEEFTAEKESLISTYFNINAQKDSEATARLTRAATLLAKLSVLFLPVSFLTSYFSTQINDLQDTFTASNYWHAFAIIMSLSFLALFFFSRLLMYVTETLDVWTKNVSEWFAGFIKKTKAD